MSQIQEIKDRLDIVEIIGEKIQLQRSGKNFRALCPFHSERTPSFFVSPELQTFKCFGCGKQGDIFTFLEEYERLTFRETLEVLAKRAGVELTTEINDPQEQLRRRVFACLEAANKFFSYLLTDHKAGEPAKKYLKQRQTNASIVKSFNLGYAPQGWNELTNYLLKKKKFSEKEIEAAGLAIRGRGGRLYDRFRHRLMFPLLDHRGRVMGFSGRTLDPAAKEAKYINTPETMVYHKRHLLFGYWQNLAAIREKEAVIVVEGEFDVLSSVQAHVKNTVGIKGSALTEEQVRLLSRTVKTIYLALDADEAGVEATKRAIATIQGFEVALRIIPVAGGKDPDDIARENPKTWREMIKKHLPAFEYVLDQSCVKNNLDSAAGQRLIADEMLKLINSIDHPVERNFYLQKLAEKLDTPMHALEEQLEKVRRRSQARLRTPPSSSSSPSPSFSSSTSPGSAQNSNLKGQDLSEAIANQSTNRLIKILWQLTLHSPNPEAKVPVLLKITTKDTLLSNLKEQLEKYWQKQLKKTKASSDKTKSASKKEDKSNNNPAFELADFFKQLPAELHEIVQEMYLQELPYSEDQLEKVWLDILAKIRLDQQKKKLSIITKKIAKLEKLEELTQQQEEEYQTLLADFQRLSAKLTSALQNQAKKV